MPAITGARVSALNTATFSAASDVDAWNQARLKEHFLSWFNRKVADQGAWRGVKLVDTPANRVGFHSFWNNFAPLNGGTVTPFQYLALMGIFANECRADFKPASERMGRTGYPGLTYLYEEIPGVKKSYNTLPGNKTAYQCFHSAAFSAAHATRAGWAQLRNTTDVRWSGAVYPRTNFPTAADAAVAGCIMETDFMKFRGRGFIQTTTRANYAKLIQYVLDYTGDNNVIDYYQAAWSGRPVDEIADASSNDDWDRLFEQTDLIIAAQAIRSHDQGAGRYLALTGDPDAAIVNMGKRISGGTKYAELYRERMESLITQALL